MKDFNTKAPGHKGEAKPNKKVAEEIAATYHDPAERGYLRLFYRNWPPTRLGKLVTGA